MIIKADKEGHDLINSVINEGMKGGAFGAADVKVLFLLQSSIKIERPHHEDQNENADNQVSD